MKSNAGSIFEVVFNAAGIDPDGGPVQPPLDVDLDSVLTMTSPVAGPLAPHVPALVERARQILETGEWFEPGGRPLPDEARTVEVAVELQLESYGTPASDIPDRLYVLEFQGYQRQYVMFGHTTALRNRLTAHRLAAAPHGFALLQGWVSPGVQDARTLERLALLVAETLHGQVHYRERFYEMPFSKALSVGRAVFELHAEEPS